MTIKEFIKELEDILEHTETELVNIPKKEYYIAKSAFLKSDIELLIEKLKKIEN